MNSRLIQRYLKTTLDHLDLARRNLQGEFDQDNEENPTETLEVPQGESVYNLIEIQIEMIQAELELIEEEFKISLNTSRKA